MYVYMYVGVYPQSDNYVMGPLIAIESNNLNPSHNGNTYSLQFVPFSI